MQARPKLNIVLTTGDKLLERMGWMMLVCMWCLTLYYFPGLPAVIPIHFSTEGSADGYGNKLTILLLPAITTIVFLGLTTLIRYPHVYNYPAKITPANAFRQYTLATRLLRYIKTMIVLIFTFIDALTLLAAKGKAISLGWWFLPCLLVPLLTPVVYFIVKWYKAQQ